MVNQILSTLKNRFVSFKYGSSATDMGTYEDKVITINLIPCIVPTIIHEIIHHLHPDWEEERVEECEESLYDNMSYKTKKHILTMFLWRVANVKKAGKAEKNEHAKKGVLGKGGVHQPAPHQGTLKRR